MRLLIAEDDNDIRRTLVALLQKNNYTVDETDNGTDAYAFASRGQYDGIILDIMMPGMSGLRTCEEIRKNSNVPVLFLTAKAGESDKLIGLMAGGDDYLSKPFSYAELLGRVKALLRRYRIYKGKDIENEEEEDVWIERDGIKINKMYNEVILNGKAKEMSDIEYNILLLMMQYPRKIFSAQNLYESIWDEPYFYSCNSTVMVHIRKLRVKIEPDPKNPRYIKTIWGKGYKFGEGI